jgi:flagellar biosynthesis/type III secretory pathway protein FliH
MNKTTIRDVEYYQKEISDFCCDLEDQVKDLTQQLEDVKAESLHAQSVAEEKGWNEGYEKGFADAEKKFKPKFQFR